MNREVIREINRQMQELNADMIREMNRGMNRQMQELKEDMIREMNRGMNRQMQELKADMIPEMNREMNREMQEMKADMIRDMQRLVRNSSAEGNVNARCSLDHQLKKSEERELRLLFANQLPDKIFTRDKIRDERDESIQIKLIETVSWETVELDPLSLMEIEIVVLDGDFGYKGNENWTEQEFNAKIVQQKKTGPLVKGKQNIMLRKGVGIIDDLSFFDNSSWNACGKFRLGARVLQRSRMGQARIKEAISQAFAVRDYRGKNTLGLLRLGLGGSTGMQNYRNHASSSHHKGRFSTTEEIVPNLASQPLATSTGYPVNAQRV
ncbi:hypothetical protein Q3G72_000390 [Acer saccharum]|nr:hypothetical protein Q3G72_000390 [Acer saccharum]